MEYLDIIEENFTKADYVAYLRGYILQSLLKDKPLDTLQFKLCADKLVQMLQEDQVDEQTENLVDQSQPITEHKFEIGDRVVINKNKADERTGVIIRLPMEYVDNPPAYVVELDDKDLGWIARVSVDGVNSKNAWFASSEDMELLED